MLAAAMPAIVGFLAFPTLTPQFFPEVDRNQFHIQIELPEATAEASKPDDESLEILIDAQGRYFLGEQQVVNTELNTLKGAIREALGERESVPVMIRADARTPHQAVVRALDATSQLGLVNISLATSKIEE